MKEKGESKVKHIVMFSGGIQGWACAKRVTAQYGPQNTLLLFADVSMEDEDLYRFLDEAASDTKAELVKVKEGRDPWQVFHDVRFLGNTRIDPCSRILKRQLLRDWLNAHYDASESVIYLGIDWSEEHRFERAKSYWKPYNVKAPLCDRPYLTKNQMIGQLKETGIQPPRLYAMGFPHNNCGGFCIKAGHAQFKLLLEKLPERFKYHENKEQELREYLGKDVAILRDRTGGTTKPLTLKAFRERIEQTNPGELNKQLDLLDWGGCGCFSPSEEELNDTPEKETRQYVH